MSVDLESLKNKTRLLFEIPLRPVQGERFQPTVFPNLGASTYSSTRGQSLLVESAQSMANRLELTIWDQANNTPIAEVEGISHVIVVRGAPARFLTDSMIESHRLNSPYILESSDKSVLEQLKSAVKEMPEGVIDRKLFAETILKYDIGSLVHGLFLAKKELCGGRLRIPRALSAFIEATGVRMVASGGVKNDSVNPKGVAKKGFGNVPFPRDEYTAEDIRLYVNLDLAQIRGFGLGDDAVRLLILSVLFKLRRLVNGDLRLRTACDFTTDCREIRSSNVDGYELPSQDALAEDLKLAIEACRSKMAVSTVKFDDALAEEGEKSHAQAESEAVESGPTEP